MVWHDIVLGGGVASVAILGLASWLGKVWANRILEKDRAKYQTQMDTLLQDLRTRDSKELFVHRLQFEKEFGVYNELWKAVLGLGRTVNDFRALQIGPPKSHEEIIQAISASYDALASLVHDNRPFYAPSVFSIAKSILALVEEICLSDRHRGRKEQKSKRTDKHVEELIELDKKIEHDLNKINELIGRLSDAIHKRIWSTRERGWDRDA